MGRRKDKMRSIGSSLSKTTDRNPFIHPLSGQWSRVAGVVYSIFGWVGQTESKNILCPSWVMIL